MYIISLQYLHVMPLFKTVSFYLQLKERQFASGMYYLIFENYRKMNRPTFFNNQCIVSVIFQVKWQILTGLSFLNVTVCSLDKIKLRKRGNNQIKMQTDLSLKRNVDVQCLYGTLYSACNLHQKPIFKNDAAAWMQYRKGPYKLLKIKITLVSQNIFIMVTQQRALSFFLMIQV